MFKANNSLTTEKRGMAVKTVDRTFLHGQSVDLFRAAIKSQATRDPYERRLIAFLSSERARADRGEISLQVL
jgi:hypothetical protein